MSSKPRLVLYCTPAFKQKIEEIAASARPPTSASKMGIYLLELGLKALEEDTARIVRRPLPISDVTSIGE